MEFWGKCESCNGKCYNNLWWANSKSRKIEKYIKQAGFKSLGIFKEFNIEKIIKRKIQFIIFTILAIVTMYISMGHMIGLPTLKFLSAEHNPINYAVSLLILTIAFLGMDMIF